MGLDTSHGCWHGAYSAFMTWRRELAKAAGLPPLDLMEGFYVPLGAKGGLPTLYYGFRNEGDNYLEDLDSRLPISWNCLKPNPLHILLNHSDCDGELSWEDCSAIAASLEELLPKLPKGDCPGHIGNWKDKTKTFIDGLRDAYSKQENVNFH